MCIPDHFFHRCGVEDFSRSAFLIQSPAYFYDRHTYLTKILTPTRWIHDVLGPIRQTSGSALMWIRIRTTFWPWQSLRALTAFVNRPIIDSWRLSSDDASSLCVEWICSILWTSKLKMFVCLVKFNSLLSSIKNCLRRFLLRSFLVWTSEWPRQLPRRTAVYSKQ